MSIIKLFYLESVFFIVYFIMSSPIMLPLIKYEAILIYFDVPVSHDIKSAVNIIFLFLLIVIFVLANNATKLCLYLDYEFIEALWSPVNFVKNKFRKSGEIE